MVSCSDELAIHSCPLVCLQRQVAKLASGVFYYWFLLRHNNMAKIFKGLIQVTVACALPQGCQIGHFMANFEKFDHFLNALAMKKHAWPFFEIWPFFWPFFQFFTIH